MSHTYKVKTNQQFDFDITSSEALALDTLSVSESQSHILYKDTSYKAEVMERDFINKSYVVKINNTSYTVDIKDDLDQLIDQMGFTVGASKQIDALKAPMPGLILHILVKVGQEVQENDVLLILEAMKMENSLTSPRQGIIKSIAVKNGQAIEKSQLLIEFE